MARTGHILIGFLWAWLLWEHWVETRYPIPETRDERGVIKGLRNVTDSWQIGNAVETRDQCIQALHKRPEGIQSAAASMEQNLDPRERAKFQLSKGRSEISIELTMTQDIGIRTPRPEKSLATVKLWCLPAGVDPKTAGGR